MWQQIQSRANPDIHVFFGDPDPVFLEQADPDLNLAQSPPPQ